MHNRILECIETCESAFKDNFSEMKRKSRSRKRNINKCKKRKKVTHSERKREITKIAPDLPEEKTCKKTDIELVIVMDLKIDKRWANALASSCCNLLDVWGKEELHRIICDDVDVGDDESSDVWESDYGESDVDCSRNIDYGVDIDDMDDMDGANEIHGVD